MKAFLRIILVSAVFLGAVIVIPSSSQETDPFYYRQLSLGENHFLTQDYDLALKHLEIAAFGLTREKSLRSKALLYMSLCHFQLEDMPSSEEQLRKADEIMGEKGLTSLGLPSAVAEDVETLLIRFGLSAPPQNKTEEEQSISEEAEDVPLEDEIPADKVATRQDLILQLKAELKANPSNKQGFIDLFNAYAEAGNLKQGKRILKRLVKQYPSDLEGLFLLAKASFKLRQFPEAIKNFERLLEYIEYSESNKELIHNSKAMVILAAFYRGDQAKISAHTPEWKDILLENMDDLDLQPTERAILQGILEDLPQEIE